MSSAVLFFGRICLSFSRYEWFVCVLHPEDYSSIFFSFSISHSCWCAKRGSANPKDWFTLAFTSLTIV